MTLLLIGILLFVGVHLIPSLAPQVKTGWRGKLGEGGYKGSFSVLLLASFVLMVMGWQGADPTAIYQPNPYLRQPAIAIAMIAIGLLVIGSRNSRIRQGVRHPQLLGVFMWSLAHIMMNGDSRSVVLFGAMLLWSIVEMVAISRREGEWDKDDIPSIGSELITAVIIVATVTLLVYAHPYITGTRVLY